MEDFFYAGGIRALMHSIREHLDLECLTVTGRTLGENIEGARVFNDDVIRPLAGRSMARARLRCCAATSPPTAYVAQLSSIAQISSSVGTLR